MFLTQELKLIETAAVFVPLFDLCSTVDEALGQQHFGSWTCRVFIGFLLS
jgi:hypothetical protein